MCTYLTIKTCMYISYISLILSNQKLYLLVAPGKRHPLLRPRPEVTERSGTTRRRQGRQFLVEKVYWREDEKCTFGHVLIDVAGVLPFIDLLDVFFFLFFFFRISKGQQHFANPRFLEWFSKCSQDSQVVDRIQRWIPVSPTRTYLDNCWRQTDEPLHTPREKHPGCRGFSAWVTQTLQVFKKGIFW